MFDDIDDIQVRHVQPYEAVNVKPPALAKTSFKKEDMVTAADTNAEHAANCQAMWDKSGGFTNEGPFTPFQFHGLWLEVITTPPAAPKFFTANEIAGVGV